MQDEDTFAVAFPRLLRLAYRVAFRILGNREEASDIAAETLARALVRWSRLAVDPEPWIATVAGRAAIDAVRRAASARRHIYGGASRVSHDPEHDNRLDLQQALLKLPRRQREVVFLRYIADRSEQQTASALGLSVGTVKSHGSRGLAALRLSLCQTTRSE